MAKNLSVGDRVWAKVYNDKGTVSGIMVRGKVQEIQVALDAGVAIFCTPYHLIKLVPGKPLRKYWVNTYPDGFDDIAHKTKEKADANAWEDRIECVLVREVRRKK